MLNYNVLMLLIKHNQCYTAKYHQPVAMLLYTGLNNVVLLTLIKVVNNGEQHCHTPFSLNNIVQCC